jgi:hypothetical protein
MTTDKQGWADKPINRRRIRLFLYAACALLAVVDLAIDRHIGMPAERVPAFYALYGFAALVGVVLAAKGLRRLVRRDEDYYDR